MPYVQIQIGENAYITRSLTLATNARRSGYPGYVAEFTDMRRSVRSILYTENDIVYLTDDKTFYLSISDGQTIFTASPHEIPYKISDMISPRIYPWRDEWANMKTDVATRNDLLWPVREWREALEIIYQREYRLLFRDGESGEWICPIDSFGGTALVSAAFSWKNSNAARFRLLKKGEQYGVVFLGHGTLDAEQWISFKSNRDNPYVKGWSVSGSIRWFLTDDIGDALFFDMQSSNNGIYFLSKDGKQLNKGGYWAVRLGPGMNDGVEFYNQENRSNIPVVLYITAPQLSDTERYIFNQNKFVNLMRDQNNELEHWRPEGVTENLPRGGSICSETEWEGTNINCYRRSNTPYIQSRGLSDCTTLDDFSNDMHCRYWALGNRGSDIDTKLFTLCADTRPGTNDEICSCYRPDQVYYDAIIEQRKNDPELGRQVANDVRATNLLQCVSGQCKPGTFSANMYYHGSRKCDVCIQALRSNIQAGGNISGNINIRQVCTQTDTTYTWEDLISRLIDLGAGTYPHVQISNDRSTITLMSSSTPSGRRAIQYTPSLSSIINRDTNGNIVLTQSIWSKNPTKYSNDILIFFIEGRA